MFLQKMVLLSLLVNHLLHWVRSFVGWLSQCLFVCCLFLIVWGGLCKHLLFYLPVLLHFSVALGTFFADMLKRFGNSFMSQRFVLLLTWMLPFATQTYTFDQQRKKWKNIWSKLSSGTVGIIFFFVFLQKKSHLGFLVNYIFNLLFLNRKGKQPISEYIFTNPP